MKKSTQIFKSIIAIAAVTIFVSCKKEIERPQNDFNGSQKAIPAAQPGSAVAMAKPKPTIVIIPDCTKTHLYIAKTNF